MNKTLLYAILSFTAFVLFAWFFDNILIYICVSLVLSTLLRPITNYLSQLQVLGVHVPRVFAVLASFLLIFGIIALFIILFIPLVSDQIRVLSSLEYKTMIKQLSFPIKGIESFLIRYRLTDQEPGFMVTNIRESVVDFVSDINIKDFFSGLIVFTGNFLLFLLAVVFITFFFLLEKNMLKRQFIAMIPNQYFEVSISAFDKIGKLLSNYLLGILMQATSIFVIASVGLSILRIDYALTVALFAAIANIIPYLGPILGATFGILVSISTLTGLTATHDYVILIVKVASVFSAIQLIDNLVLQPFIFSRSVKAHPLEIFIIIFIGAKIAGILGMIAAIPTYTIIRVTFIEMHEGFRQYEIFKT